MNLQISKFNEEEDGAEEPVPPTALPPFTINASRSDCVLDTSGGPGSLTWRCVGNLTSDTFEGIEAITCSSLAGVFLSPLGCSIKFIGSVFQMSALCDLTTTRPPPQVSILCFLRAENSLWSSIRIFKYFPTPRTLLHYLLGLDRSGFATS